jgi:hypothetical protein
MVEGYGLMEDRKKEPGFVSPSLLRKTSHKFHGAYTKRNQQAKEILPKLQEPIVIKRAGLMETEASHFTPANRLSTKPS